MHSRLFLCSVLLIGACTNCMEDPKIKALESEIEKLTDTSTNASCAVDLSLECLFYAKSFLNDSFDNDNAIKWFNNFLKIYGIIAYEYKSKLLEEIAHTGIAMAYHNVGRQAERDSHMSIAKSLLCINDVQPLDSKNTKEPACDYFVVDGYRHYIKFEESERNKEPIEAQEGHLNAGMLCFITAAAISGVLGLDGFVKSHALQGLGTTFEFLGKCKLQSNRREGAVLDFKCANAYFEEAVKIREKLLKPNHPLVARSLHKLARNCCLLGEFWTAPELIKKAENVIQSVSNFCPK